MEKQYYFAGIDANHSPYLQQLLDNIDVELIQLLQEESMEGYVALIPFKSLRHISIVGRRLWELTKKY